MKNSEYAGKALTDLYNKILENGFGIGAFDVDFR